MREKFRIPLLPWIFLWALILATMAGCSSFQKNGMQETSFVVKDSLGREVAIPQNIERIAAIDSFSGEVLIMVGAGDKVVACPNGVKRNTLLKEIYPQLPDIAVVQEADSINAEALLELEPDVILLKNSFYIAEAERQKLDKLQIPYLVLQYSTIEEQREALLLLEKVVQGEAGEKIRSVNEYYGKIVDLVKMKSQLIPEENQKRIYHAINEAVRTDGVASLGADWIPAAGGINVSVGAGLTTEGDNYYASMEQVFLWDPDLIICNDANTAKYFQTDEKWTGLRAVQEGKVYPIPIGVSRWGQGAGAETFFAMLWLGKTIYPEIYQDVDLKQEVYYFYQDILGIPMDETTYANIISGQGIRLPKQ